MRYPSLLAIASACVLVAGCGVVDPSVPPTPAPSSSATVSAGSAPAVTVTPASSPTSPATATATATAKPTPVAPPKDTRKGGALRTPYSVNGIIVVSQKHRIAASYKAPNPSGPYGLDAPAATALNKMIAAARKAGVHIRVRSAYRTWATQNAIYQKALRNYPQNISFYAPAGASEHQTGLAVDLWDGVTWSLPMAKTAAGKWLFAHAHDYGFVLRYPDGKMKVTGYHYEPWHYRYIGVQHSRNFPNNTLTLEEYLGLA